MKYLKSIHIDCGYIFYGRYCKKMENKASKLLFISVMVKDRTGGFCQAQPIVLLWELFFFNIDSVLGKWCGKTYDLGKRWRRAFTIILLRYFITRTVLSPVLEILLFGVKSHTSMVLRSRFMSYDLVNKVTTLYKWIAQLKPSGGKWNLLSIRKL